MPVLEAAFHGKPVIVSDLPVFREIAEGVADALVGGGGLRRHDRDLTFVAELFR